MNRRAVVMVVAMACAGCAVGPDYVTSEVSLPTQFVGPDVQAPADEPVVQQWWNNFNDTLLAQLVTDAVRSNNDLQGAIGRVNQSRALYNQTFLNLSPTITMDGQYTNTHVPTSTFAGDALKIGQDHIENDYFSTGFDAV